MCDYSLMSIPNRLAKEGEELVTHRFGTGCLGLASPLDLYGDPNPGVFESRTFWSLMKEFFHPPEGRLVPAVCIPPGAFLLLMDIPEKLQREFGIGPVEEVVFNQSTAATNTFRDAVRFTNGREILLQGLRESQRVRVLRLDRPDTRDPVTPEDLLVQTVS